MKIIWLGDKLSNMRALYRSWKREGKAMWWSFNQTDPAQQAWYYRSIVRLTAELGEYEAWQELDYLVDLIFKGV